MDYWALGMAIYNSPNAGAIFEKVILFLVAWWMVRKEMRKQFDKLTSTIATFGEALKSVEMGHGARLTNLEQELLDIQKGKKDGL